MEIPNATKYSRRHSSGVRSQAQRKTFPENSPGGRTQSPAQTQRGTMHFPLTGGLIGGLLGLILRGWEGAFVIGIMGVLIGKLIQPSKNQ